MSDPIQAATAALVSDIDAWTEGEPDIDTPCLFWDWTGARIAAYLATNGFVAGLIADNAALRAENNTATALSNDWEQAASLLAAAGHDHLAGCVYQLARRIDHLTAAIATHHTTKHGSDPATARAVLSPPDRALYAAAGVPHAVLGTFAGRDEAG